jgi:hypothetical protein
LSGTGVRLEWNAHLSIVRSLIGAFRVVLGKVPDVLAPGCGAAASVRTIASGLDGWQVPGSHRRLHHLQGLRGSGVCNLGATRVTISRPLRDLALYLRPRGPLAQLGERRPCTEYHESAAFRRSCPICREIVTMSRSWTALGRRSALGSATEMGGTKWAAIARPGSDVPWSVVGRGGTPLSRQCCRTAAADHRARRRIVAVADASDAMTPSRARPTSGARTAQRRTSPTR